MFYIKVPKQWYISILFLPSALFPTFVVVVVLYLYKTICFGVSGSIFFIGLVENNIHSCSKALFFFLVIFCKKKMFWWIFKSLKYVRKKLNFYRIFKRKNYCIDCSFFFYLLNSTTTKALFYIIYFFLYLIFSPLLTVYLPQWCIKFF